MNNEAIFEESKKYMPGGVNSPVRAYKGIDMTPPVIKSGKGVIIKDEDGNEYIDFVLAWGPLILGHCNDQVVKAIEDTAKEALTFGAPTKLELDLAKIICDNMKNVDMIRMVNSGTEATMSAIKLARGYTNKNKIIKFAGCYHGHYDGFLVEAGSGVILTEGVPGSLGVPNESVKNTLVGVYNDSNQVAELFEKYKGEIAAVIVEPVAGNMGVVRGKDSFLKDLRKLCDDNGSLLIYDEVMNGFRIAYKGMQELVDVKPDLITYAKIIGGGLPCGAYGGRKEIMENLAPLGKVYQAGTMSGNPIVMAAGLATLKQLTDHPEYYDHINKMGQRLEDGLNAVSKEYNFPITVNRVGGMFTIFFTDKGEVTSYEDVKKCDIDMFNRYFKYMITHGINIAPSQFEAVFLSTEHKEEHIDKFIDTFRDFVKSTVGI